MERWCSFADTSGELVERFELCAGEVDVLVATNRRRKRLIKRFQEVRAVHEDLPF